VGSRWVASTADGCTAPARGPRAGGSAAAGYHFRSDDVNGPYRGAGLELGLRGFWRPTAPEGLWLMLRGVGAWTWTVDPAPAAAEPGGYASLLVGGTWVGERGLTLSGGLGASVFGYEVGGYGPQGPAVAAHSAAGWAF
jgi:hypothetical protein